MSLLGGRSWRRKKRTSFLWLPNRWRTSNIRSLSATGRSERKESHELQVRKEKYTLDAIYVTDTGSTWYFTYFFYQQNSRRKKKKAMSLISHTISVKWVQSNRNSGSVPHVRVVQTLLSGVLLSVGMHLTCEGFRASCDLHSQRPTLTNIHVQWAPKHMKKKLKAPF